MHVSEARDLEVLLSYLLNRQLKQSEIIVSLGISRSAYYDQKERGQLASPANLISAATYFGLNPVDLLVRYGHISVEDVHEAWANWQESRNDRNPLVMSTTEGGGTTGRRHYGPAI
jgi:predicted XRE-type DNA-binding protein